MPVTIKFYTIQEKTPKHNEEIVFLVKQGSGFDSYYFEPRSGKVEYSWLVMEDGDFTGTSICYESDADKNEIEEDVELSICVEGYYMDENILWCSEEEYFKAFEDGLK